VPVLLCRFLPALPDLGAPVSPAVHRWSRHRASLLGQHLRGTRGGSLERRPLVMEKSLDGFPQVFHQMKPIHDLDSVWGATANAVRIERAAIPTDDGHGRMLDEPLRHHIG